MIINKMTIEKTITTTKTTTKRAITITTTIIKVQTIITTKTTIGHTQAKKEATKIQITIMIMIEATTDRQQTTMTIETKIKGPTKINRVSRMIEILIGMLIDHLKTSRNFITSLKIL